jgi:hypothetical protein
MFDVQKYQKEYRQKNALKIKEYKKSYSLRNKKKMALFHKKYYAENAQKLKDRSKDWYQSHLEYRKDYDAKRRVLISSKTSVYMKEYYLKNRDSILEKNRENRFTERYKKMKTENHKKKFATDPQYKISVALRGRMNSYFRNGKTVKLDATMKLLGCDLSTVRFHLEKQFKEGMTWKNHNSQGWHIDHIKPLASFDLMKIEEQRKAFHYTNLQPLWAFENLSKGSKIQ